MSRQRTRDTAPEIALRKELHARGRRFRLGLRVPGFPRRTIDIAFAGAHVAIFVDGCFWHDCPEHGTSPRANRGWWSAKLEQNVLRDRQTDAHLRRAGWRVVRVWEHESVPDAADRIEAVLGPRRP
jgi:DNA mismatch endonuclease (patch repair protein)